MVSKPAWQSGLKRRLPTYEIPASLCFDCGFTATLPGPFRRGFGHLAHIGRTHPCASFKSLRRAIHKLLNANKVCNCAVFLTSPL